MQHLDGNALAGPLAELFTFDATTASARCLGCGTVSMLATAMAYADAMGTVLHCGTCDAVLLALVEGPDRTWINLQGITALEVPRP